MKDIIEDSFRYEKIFSENSYFGNPKGKEFEFAQGTLPIIISSPHSVHQIRKNKIKFVEVFTGSLNILLNKDTGVHSLFKLKCSDLDDNFDYNTRYKIFLKEIIEKHNIRLVIDLHGMNDNHGLDIDIGTKENLTCSNEYISTLKECFKFNGVEMIGDNQIFKALPEGTVTSYIHSITKVDVMQIEIANKNRNIYRKENQENYLKAYRSLISFIFRVTKKLEH
ncbi:conserved hypothetical protein [Alkaliphilus metalliredigens QYMF]|uniref:N-formylglutamate amidohydrolase n=1 Tax=Alkaliphilus metalliredigens (strain QYMF) TaxID=293826 RepID=A6TMW7_ALKMQ|nr:N-formylglutamate amidohydrolase [Alkaliphilus metalliredigens]ABR47535.1 conserved hypothetical protein [Alkaliphilus metalliredigens QYMF]